MNRDGESTQAGKSPQKPIYCGSADTDQLAQASQAFISLCAKEHTERREVKPCVFFKNVKWRQALQESLLYTLGWS